MPRYASLAEQYRAHRAEMQLALATGCTPIEARRELRRQAKARRAACGRLAIDAAPDPSPTLAAGQAETDFRSWGSSWMMRD